MSFTGLYVKRGLIQSSISLRVTSLKVCSSFLWRFAVIALYSHAYIETGVAPSGILEINPLSLYLIQFLPAFSIASSKVGPSTIFGSKGSSGGAGDQPVNIRAVIEKDDR